MEKTSTSVALPANAAQAPTQVMPDFPARDSEWISCKQAGKILDLSERRVQELAKMDLLESARAKDPKRGNQFVTVILRASVLRYKEEKRNPPPSPVIPREPPQRPQIAAPADTVTPNSIPPTPKRPLPFVQIAEASAYSGLPQSKLRELYDQNKLAGYNCGPRLGGSLLFRREDLDNLRPPFKKDEERT